MSLHPALESDEVRPCPNSIVRSDDGLSHCSSRCPDCNGTGQLGDPEAPLVLEVFEFSDTMNGEPEWFWKNGPEIGYGGSTPEAALAAGWKALAKEET